MPEANPLSAARMHFGGAGQATTHLKNGAWLRTAQRQAAPVTHLATATFTGLTVTKPPKPNLPFLPHLSTHKDTHTHSLLLNRSAAAPSAAQPTPATVVFTTTHLHLHDPSMSMHDQAERIGQCSP